MAQSFHEESCHLKVPNRCGSAVPNMQAVLVVANNLLMSSGKIGSQCAHAALGLYKIIMANRVPWYPAFEVSQSQLAGQSETSVQDFKSPRNISPQFCLARRTSLWSDK